jgi:5-formyltetrahydrofolate cyclo-ligase
VTAPETKAGIRHRLIAARRAIEPPQREAWTASITTRLEALQAWRDARVIHAYVGALDGEVGTRAIVERALAEGRTVACPRVRREPPGLASYAIRSLDDLVAGPRGLWEPDPDRGEAVPDSALDLVLVPGIAFDRRGWRIGFGAGYYDRFLAGVAAATVGLAFSLQILDKLPVEPHDVPVDWIMTEGETIACRAIRELSEREAIP